MMNIKSKQTSFKHTTTNFFGGYITYWKLFFSMILNISQCSLYTRGQKIRLILHLVIVKSVWYLFIKPLGFVVSIKNILEGTKIIHEGYKNMDTAKGKKTFVVYLFRKIPIFYIKKNFSREDILEVLG